MLGVLVPNWTSQTLTELTDRSMFFCYLFQQLEIILAIRTSEKILITLKTISTNCQFLPLYLFFFLFLYLFLSYCRFLYLFQLLLVALYHLFLFIVFHRFPMYIIDKPPLLQKLMNPYNRPSITSKSFSGLSRRNIPRPS